MGIEEARVRLGQLYESYGAEVDFPWKYESDRFAELVYCVLDQLKPGDAAATRAAVGTLQYLRLLGPEALVTMRTKASREATVAGWVLERHGFTGDATGAALDALSSLGAEVVTKLDGRPQRLLRQHGLALRDALTGALAEVALPAPQLERAVTHFLQNALNMPISVAQDAVTVFCQSHQISLEELTQVADDQGLNLAVIDDLLELEAQLRKAPTGALT